VEPPPHLPPHLHQAWTSICEMLRAGERLILVFGPPGCGKTALVREACAACGLELSSLKGAEDVRGKVVHIENAESVPGLDTVVRNAIKAGARCVILETRRPRLVLARVGGTRLVKAVYTPPPDAEARREILKRLLGESHQGLIDLLGDAVQAYSLRGLMRLAASVRRKSEGRGEALDVAGAVHNVPPDLTPEDLAECENFVATFHGVITGFYRPASND